MPDREEKKPTLKVTDRRSFTPEGDRRNPGSSEESSAPSPGRSPEGSPRPAPPVQGESFEMRPAPEPPPSAGMEAVDFSSFILSLTSTAFIHLGDMEDPVTRTRTVHLAAARQMIDIIDMLRAKTKGNLEPQEAEFIDQVLYELKMRFAEKAGVR
jgi:hypothetical protein